MERETKRERASNQIDIEREEESRERERERERVRWPVLGSSTRTSFWRLTAN